MAPILGPKMGPIFGAKNGPRFDVQTSFQAMSRPWFFLGAGVHF